MFKILPNYLHYTQSGAGGSTTIVNSGSLSGSLPFYNVGDFPSFQSAITSLGTKPATLYISSGVTITSNVVIPRNIDLVFTNSGSITVSNGVTGVHLGNIQAPPHQIFFNIYSGQGAMNFYNASLQNLKIAKYYLPWWAGTGGYKGDSKSGIQAAIDALYINSTLYAPFGCNYLIASPISMYGKYGLNLIAENGNGYQNLGQPFSNFKWSGQSGGTMLEMQHCSHCKVDGWGFDALNSISGALICINIDGEGNPTSTQNTISNNYFRCSPLTGCIGVSLSKEAVSNNEFMTFEKNIFSAYGYHSGYGLYMGRSSNAHGHILRDNNFFYFIHGIHMENGSFKMEGLNNFNSNEVDIYINDTSYPTIIEGADSESSYQFAYINNQNNPVYIHACRMQSSGHSPDEGLLKFGTQSRWISCTDNMMTNIGTSTGYVYDGRAAASLLLITANNRYPASYTDDKIYKELWHTNTSHLSLDNGQIKGQLIGRGKAGPADGEFPPFKFENTQSGNRFINLMLSKVTGALEWDYMRMYLTQSGLVRQPIAYTTDITGANKLFTGVNSIQVTGFTAQTGIIGISGLGTVTVLTGTNNFIYISGGSVSSSSTNLANVITGSGIINYLSKFNYQTGLTNSNIYDLNGQISIGTTSPSSNKALTINGNASIKTVLFGDTDSPYISLSNSSGTTIGYGANTKTSYLSATIPTVVNGQTVTTTSIDGIVLNGSQKFGIIYPLSLNGGGTSFDNAADVIILHNAYATSGSGISNFRTKWQTSHASFGSRGIEFSFNQGIQFYADNSTTVADGTFQGTERMRISNNGNISINNTSAISTLDVSGDISASGINISNIRGLTGRFIKIILSGNAPASYNSFGLSGELALSGTNLYICTGDNAWGRIPILDF